MSARLKLSTISLRMFKAAPEIERPWRAGHAAIRVAARVQSPTDESPSCVFITPASQFTLLSGDADLTDFEFNKHLIQHKFCSTCGIQSFAIGTHPKTGVKMAAVNVRCVDGVDVDSLQVRKVDGDRKSVV